ncbi:MAG: heme exporter protein CcmB [Methylococcaceae bacterium]|nr:heme exporter protein CcmB [Methylococcaceae bacterium]
MNFFTAIVRRDLVLALRNRNEVVNPLAFFMIVIALFPLAVSPETAVLSKIAPGIIWVAALLATLLSLDGLFKSDFDDGSLEQILVSPQSLALLAIGKVLSHWLMSGFLLALLSPLLAIMLFLPSQAVGALVGSLLLGTPTLSLIGAIGAALTVGLRKGGVLISLLVLPLYIPVLIFGAGAVQAGVMGMPIAGYLALLGAMMVFSLMFAPFAIAAALKLSIRN